MDQCEEETFLTDCDAAELKKHGRVGHFAVRVNDTLALGELASGTEAGVHLLIAAAPRYVVAHWPTMTTLRQAYEIALKLHRGDRLFEEK
jgi:hypothetical protein